MTALCKAGRWVAIPMATAFVLVLTALHLI